MKVFQNSLFMMGLLAVTMGCGSKNPKVGNAPSAESTDTGQSQEEKLLQSATISCANPEECTPGVGMLVTLQADQSLGMCTGFLIDPTIIATASSCLPPELRQDGANCAGRIRMVFPKTSQLEGMSSGCSQIISVSSGNTNTDQDFAFIRLTKPVIRQTLPVDPVEVSADTQVILPSIKGLPSSKNPRAELMMRECKVIDNSNLINSGNSKLMNPLSLLGDCEVIETNRGAPIIDNQGHVRGILQGPLSQDEIQKVKNYLSESLNHLAIASNFGCIRLPLDGAAAPGNCASTPPSQTPPNGSDPTDQDQPTLITPPDPTAAAPEVQRKAQPWMDSNAKVLRWKLSPTAIEGPSQPTVNASSVDLTSLPPRKVRYQVQPACFQKLDGWIRDFSNFWGLYVWKKGEIKVTAPRWEVTGSLDRNLRPQYRIAALDPNAVTITFSPRDVSDRGESRVKITMPAPAGTAGGAKEIVLFEDQVRLCKP